MSDRLANLPGLLREERDANAALAAARTALEDALYRVRQAEDAVSDFLGKLCEEAR